MSAMSILNHNIYIGPGGWLLSDAVRPAIATEPQLRSPDKFGLQSSECLSFGRPPTFSHWIFQGDEAFTNVSSPMHVVTDATLRSNRDDLESVPPVRSNDRQLQRVSPERYKSDEQGYDTELEDDALPSPSRLQPSGHQDQWWHRMEALEESQHRMAHNLEQLQNQLRDLLLGQTAASAEQNSRVRNSADFTKSTTPRGKDSSGNYVRRCVRQHARQLFGILPNGIPPPPPSKDLQGSILHNVALGRKLSKPFSYDWSSPPLTAYNLCIEEAFCADFWSSVQGGMYSLSLIPPHYQTKDGFTEVLRTYLTGRRRKCADVQKFGSDAAQERAISQRHARNSRVATTFRNRRAAATRIADHRLGALLTELMDTVGTQGISSDEEVPAPPGTGKVFATFDKPWRQKALVGIYRHLDTIHASTRNPHGNPIRVRYHTSRIRDTMVVPKHLPADCYDPLYLRSLEPSTTYCLRTRPPVGVEELYLALKTSSIE
ncbi:hypothetical protein NUW54_g7007 [Trametes sanguinea]|uniref:Uncharacterized protein n=1 Tax=Trametes sanguinea TaxID=158606 RepID=A0ACC1PRQ7_9APHY|nr:hypothetical protein NUW54_g7007 [Trametes sanguinea]